MLVSGVVACMPQQSGTVFELTVLELFIKVAIPFDPAVQGFGIRGGNFKIHQDVVGFCKCHREFEHRRKALQWRAGSCIFSTSGEIFAGEQGQERGQYLPAAFQVLLGSAPVRRREQVAMSGLFA
jgi:hypothetical protein